MATGAGVTAEQPILFFDSGVGGLSVLAEVRALLPTAPIVYAADSAGFPYGTRTEQEIASRIPALLGRLVERYHPRLAVIACNTASTIALATVREALSLPVVGTVPAIKPAALSSRTRVIGVLGTEATVRQPYVDRLAAEFGADCTILRHGSARLVELAERKLAGGDLSLEEVRGAVTPLLAQPDGERLDTIVLACTHFPLLAEEIGAVVPAGVRLIDGAAGIARRVAHLTAGQAWPDDPPPGRAVFTRLGDAERRLAPALAGFGLEQLEAL